MVFQALTSICTESSQESTSILSEEIKKEYFRFINAYYSNSKEINIVLKTVYLHYKDDNNTTKINILEVVHDVYNLFLENKSETSWVRKCITRGNEQEGYKYIINTDNTYRPIDMLEDSLRCFVFKKEDNEINNDFFEFKKDSKVGCNSIGLEYFKLIIFGCAADLLEDEELTLDNFKNVFTFKYYKNGSLEEVDLKNIFAGKNKDEIASMTIEQNKSILNLINPPQNPNPNDEQ